MRYLLLLSLVLFLLVPSATAQMVFDDFEDGNADGFFQFSQTGGGIGFGITPDVPDQHGGSHALSVGVDGSQTGAFAGLGKTLEMDLSSLDNPYLNFYLKTGAENPFTLEINLQEDQDGNHAFDGNGAVDDEFQVLYRVRPGTGYHLVSIPLSSFTDDWTAFGGGDGVFSDQLFNLVFAFVDMPPSNVVTQFDYLSFSEGPLELSGSLDLYDDFEDGDVSAYQPFSATGGGVSLAPTGTAAMGTSQALLASIDGNAAGAWSGFAKTQSAMLPDAQAGYFNMFVEPDPTTPFTLEINLQEDQDDNGTFDGSGAVDDEFQAVYQVDPGTGYRLVSIPLSSFTDDNTAAAGGDGLLSDNLEIIAFAVTGLGANTVDFRIDQIGFSATAPLPVELARFDATLDGDAVALAWLTASETDNVGFAVEHRAPGTDTFAEAGWVAGAGTTSRAQTYTFRFEGDALQPGRHTFRLRQVDHDGTASYGPERVVLVAAEGMLSLRRQGASPATTEAVFTLTTADAQHVTVHVFDLLGREVGMLYDGASTAGSSRRLHLDVSGFAPGVYFVRAVGAGRAATQRLAVVR